MPSQFGGVEVEPTQGSQFGGIPVAPPSPPKESYLGGLYASTLAPLAQAARHPIDTGIGLAKAVIGTEDLDQIAKAVKSGNYADAALRVGKWAQEGPGGRMAHGIVDPVVSDLQQGNYAGAGGRATGAALTLGLPIAGELGGSAVAATAIDPVLDVASDALRTSAETGYSKVFAPTTKINKALTAKVVPELIDHRTIALSLKGLQSQAQAHIASVGSAIGDAWDNLPPGTTTELGPIYDHLQSAIDDTHSVPDASGKLVPKGPEAERAISNINKLQETLVDVSAPDPATGKLAIPSGTVRNLRQYFDDIAARAGRYGGKDLADQSAAEAHGLAADAIRSELAKDNPDIAALNKEYALWKNVNQVVSDTIARKTGQSTPLGVQIARAAGFAKGGPLGAEAMQYLTQIVRSPAWRTTSAVLKDRLADSIASGNGPQAEFYLNKIGGIGGIGQVATVASDRESPSPQPAAGAPQ